MDDFSFNNTTKIIFGKNSLDNLANEIKNYGTKILLHYGQSSIKKIGLYNKIVKILNENNIEFVELSGVKPNPRLSLVHKGIDICKKEKVDLILAVGGGSVIDSAKAIAMGVEYEGDVWDFLTTDKMPSKALPIGTILTIPAAGSEASTGCVITKEEGMLKRAVNSELIYPKFSILNPEIAYTLPKSEVANGVTDILSHLMERYFTNTKNVEITDRLIESTMKTIINNAPKVLDNMQNYEAWSEIMWAGTIAHNNLLNTGRVGDWASHGIEHEISGIYDIAHGAGLAIVFPAWMKYVYKHDVNRFVQFASRVWNVDVDYFNLEKTALKGIFKLEEFFRSIGQFTKLSEINIDETKFEEMANKATDQGEIGNFVKLESKDVLEILKIAK